jgi:pre-rRNA-processing protein RIX1
MTEFNALRPITQRLTSTPVKELPHIAFFLASSIASCGQALQTASSQASGRSNDNVALVHKLKTRISTLLQERSPEGRFAAVVLIKAVVEAGGGEILSSSSESWVRGLLSVLGRPDSVMTKKLCLMTITRIFCLTEQYPTLVREITTPLLPAFITACLTLIKPNIVNTEDGATTILSPLLEPVFMSFSELLPYHPTIFRPFAARLNTIALSLIGDPSTPLYATEVASNILTTLHFSAPKNATAAEWVQSCKSIILSCHMAADQVFRSVIEDWESSEHIEASPFMNRNYENRVQASGPDMFSLQAWIGVHDGAERIVRLLRLLLKFLSLPTAQTVSCPIGFIIDLTARLTAVTAIKDARASQFSVRPNAEVGRDERDELWTELPNIHVATLDLLSTVLDSFAEAALPIAQIIFNQTIALFEAEQRNENLRISAYRLIESLLSLVGFSLPRPDIDGLTVIIGHCCADLTSQAGAESLPDSTASSKIIGYKSSGKMSIDADLLAGHQREGFKGRPSRERESVYSAALQLLPCFLSSLPASKVPHSLRTDIDRTAILVQHQRAMLASVLNPPSANKGQRAPPSIMPFLARASLGELDIEGLLRPRMPIISNNNLQSSVSMEASDDEDSIGGLAADHTQLDSTRNAEIPDALDILDRLEHSLDKSPVHTKQDGDRPSLYRTAADTSEPYLTQSPAKNTTKRDLMALYGQGANLDQDADIQDINGSHIAAGFSTTDINKRRRLEDDPHLLDSENVAASIPVETPSLHEPELQLASENSSLRISAHNQPKKAAEIPTYALGQDTTRVQDSDEESDFEIPEIFDSTSGEDE